MSLTVSIFPSHLDAKEVRGYEIYIKIKNSVTGENQRIRSTSYHLAARLKRIPHPHTHNIADHDLSLVTMYEYILSEWNGPTTYGYEVCTKYNAVCTSYKVGCDVGK